MVKAFLMEIHQMRKPDETNRKPTWFTPEEAKKRLAKGREVKYFHELEVVIDRALERIQPLDVLGVPLEDPAEPVVESHLAAHRAARTARVRDRVHDGHEGQTDRDDRDQGERGVRELQRGQ